MFALWNVSLQIFGAFVPYYNTNEIGSSSIPNTHFWARPISGNWSMAVEFLTSLLSSVSINNS